LNLIERSAGTVLVTGPTGSGKTTTLYAGLNHLNTPEKKIITVEDPVEYRLERINQVQINAKIGLTFSTVLRTALRQDPDVVLVGEMRDAETVEIGLRAAMTGHMVFSTLHTVNAVATIHRLLDMGAEGYLIASSLHGIVAQRLARRICNQCSRSATLDDKQIAWLGGVVDAQVIKNTDWQEGIGCTYCNMTGYRGPIGIYELLQINAEMIDAIRREDLGAFEQHAAADPKYVPIVQAATDYATAGVTSVAEVMRVSSGIDHGAPIQDPLLEDLEQLEAMEQAQA